MGRLGFIGGFLDEGLDFIQVFTELLVDIALPLVLLAAGGIQMDHHGGAGHQSSEEDHQCQKADSNLPV